MRPLRCSPSPPPIPEPGCAAGGICSSGVQRLWLDVPLSYNAGRALAGALGVQVSCPSCALVRGLVQCHDADTLCYPCPLRPLLLPPVCRRFAAGLPHHGRAASTTAPNCASTLAARSLAWTCSRASGIPVSVQHSYKVRQLASRAELHFAAPLVRRGLADTVGLPQICRSALKKDAQTLHSRTTLALQAGGVVAAHASASASRRSRPT